MEQNQDLTFEKESGGESEEESEILEESPCGRWLKRREQVEQRDIPGVDSTFLAMDTEEGVEVVWNQVQFSERKNFKAQEEKIRQMFDNLTRLEHPNIVKFHRYWTDTHNDKPRVIFITEYMSSGSLKQFIKRTKRNEKKQPLYAWKRWCSQILSALSYLHRCRPPIIHGYLTCDAIFIQHNGLVKIGSVAPDAIHHHVKTCRELVRNVHFIAPEYINSGLITPAIDIYSFGMCALEMAAYGIQGNGDGGITVTEQNIAATIESLDDQQQKEFIRLCLTNDPSQRPTANELLFHPLLFEVHSLKLLAAHTVVRFATANISESVMEELNKLRKGPDTLVAVIKPGDKQVTLAEIAYTEKLEKFLDDVKNGIYPLIAYKQRSPPNTPACRSCSPTQTSDSLEVTGSSYVESNEREDRRIINMMCSIAPVQDVTNEIQLMLTILLRMEDKMNRQLNCTITSKDSPEVLAKELVQLAFVNQLDEEKVTLLLKDSLKEATNSNNSNSQNNELSAPLERNQNQQSYGQPIYIPN